LEAIEWKSPEKNHMILSDKALMTIQE